MLSVTGAAVTGGADLGTITPKASTGRAPLPSHCFPHFGADLALPVPVFPVPARGTSNQSSNYLLQALTATCTLSHC